MHVLDELEARGFIAQTSDPQALRAAMDAGAVTAYAGFDPTANSLHVGHLVSVLLLARLQRAGHRVIAVVGGGTGMVGDPSGKTEARMLLDRDAIRANLEAQRGQLSRFLDLSDPGRGRMLDNAEWLMGLGYIDFLREIGSCFSVNKMLTAEGYKQRLERGLSFIEFNYQLLQAFDFLTLFRDEGCTLQVGGNDQWGNILAGVDLVRRKESATVFGLTTPLLTTASGQKMGKTHGGAVWLDADRTPPFDFYQYWVNVDDADVERFLRLFTFLPLEEVARLAALTGPDIRTAKAALAFEVTRLVHGEEEAVAARDGAKAMVAGDAADELPTHTLEGGEAVAIYAVLADAGLTKSRGEARRMIKGGGVRLDNDKVTDEDAVLDPSTMPAEGVVLRVGKKRAARILAADTP